jgi:flagellar hook-associated protein 3 FlgL
MQALGVEVNQIIEQLVVLGNSSLRGQRLFAGELTDADPFTMVGNPPTAVNYTGDSGQLLREFDVNTTIAINVPGNTFLPAILTTLIARRDDLNSGNAGAVGNDLGAIDSALDSLLSVRSQVGAKVNRLESARERQEDVQVRLTELLSKVEDTDYTVAVSEFSLQETVYKAGLAAGSRALQPSLLDYLK